LGSDKDYDVAYYANLHMGKDWIPYSDRPRTTTTPTPKPIKKRQHYTLEFVPLDTTYNISNNNLRQFMGSPVPPRKPIIDSDSDSESQEELNHTKDITLEGQQKEESTNDETQREVHPSNSVEEENHEEISKETN